MVSQGSWSVYAAQTFLTCCYRMLGCDISPAMGAGIIHDMPPRSLDQRLALQGPGQGYITSAMFKLFLVG